MKVSAARNNQSGFTLMEILVATTIFTVTLTMMLVLLNYTLRINRRVESVRQVSQATRNFSEYLVREIRNSNIDYTGTIDSTNCPLQSPQQYPLTSNQTLALVNRAGERLCFYLSDINNGTSPPSANLKVTKRTVTGATITQQINPDNVTINPGNFRFFVRPTVDPSTDLGGGVRPGTQPFVTMVMAVNVRLSGGEALSSIPYQTTVSTDNYAIPHK